MRLHLTPPALRSLIATILLAPQFIAAKPHPIASSQAGFSWNELFARYDCSGETCGWKNQLCCQAGSACYTDTNDQAQCSSTAGGYASSQAGGHWNYYTVTTVMTDFETITTVYSSHVAGSYTAAATGASCNYALNETPCGEICCASNQYCAYDGQCAAAYRGQTTTTVVSATSYNGAQPPVRGTSVSNVRVTETQTPTTTIPFETPVETGANITMTETHHHHSGLSGGAIAGIVIGVLLGVALLLLICICCCLRGIFDSVLAIFGLGNRRRVTEVDEYERRSSHHASGGGGRTWYGASRPSRAKRNESHVGRDIVGIGAGLAALWAILGFKRRRQERRDQEKSEYSYSSDYYTSASSESTNQQGSRYSRRYTDRRTERRSDSRR